MPAINPTHQLVILARLSEYCQYRGATLSHEKDAWGYMRRKLSELQEPVTNLKKELFAATSAALLRELREGINEERFSDFKVLFERLLSPGDFADLAIHLTTQGASSEARLRAVSQILSQIKPNTLFLEESKPPEQRSPALEKLISQLYARLDFDRLGEILKRKPRTPRRKAYVLRRVRRNVAEYCSVLRIPTDPSDTFTPFMLPRIEGVIAANLRLLNKYR